MVAHDYNIHLFFIETINYGLLPSCHLSMTAPTSNGVNTGCSRNKHNLAECRERYAFNYTVMKGVKACFPTSLLRIATSKEITSKAWAITSSIVNKTECNILVFEEVQCFLTSLLKQMKIMNDCHPAVVHLVKQEHVLKIEGHFGWSSLSDTLSKGCWMVKTWF